MGKRKLMMLYASAQKPILGWISGNPEKAAIIALFVFSIFTRFLLLGYPNSAVFDEVHFNYFPGFYYTGQYYYDIHPPLAKLLIALVALPFGGIPPEEVVRTISTPYTSSTYMAMRALPAFFGSCLPVLIFMIARRLHISILSSLLAGSFIILDNAVLIQSRLILLDATLLFFGFSSLLLFLYARQNNKVSFYVLSALCAGCSISVKWIGVSFIGIIGLTMIVDWIKYLWKTGWTIRPFFIGIGFLVIALSTYASTFFIHFKLLPISHKQGDQFMSPAFQSTLKGSLYYGADGMVRSVNCPPNYQHKLKYGTSKTQVKSAERFACTINYDNWETPGFFAKLYELNRIMYTTNQGLSKAHSGASQWYTWPLMNKPLYYWHSDGARIYLIGNPIVWWFCALAVILLILGTLRFPEWRQRETFWILMTGFWANLLPFMMVSRVMFMYHYLTCLCFSVLLFAYLLEKLPKKPWIYISAFALALFSFLMVSPLTYGINWYGSNLLWFLQFFGWYP